MTGPLVVNTQAGVYVRRAESSDGCGLYALEGDARPVPVMLALDEVAEHLITGTADVLPMPVVPEPQELPLAGPICTQAEARAAGLDIAPSVEELDAMASSIVAVGDPLSAEVSLAQAVPLLGAAVTALRARIAELEAEQARLRQLPDLPVDKLAKALLLMETGPALPWAHAMSDHDLHGFLDDLVSAAMGRWRSEPEVPDRTVLADIEKVCADWRTPGVGSRLDGSEFDGAVVRLAEPEGEFHGALHHSYRLGHDLPETGGTQ